MQNTNGLQVTKSRATWGNLHKLPQHGRYINIIINALVIAENTLHQGISNHGKHPSVSVTTESTQVYLPAAIKGHS